MVTETTIRASSLHWGETELRNDANAGEESTIAALYDRHAAALYAYVLAITADVVDAEDVVHEVFERALRRQRQLFGLGNPVGYMYRAARNAAYDRLRRQAVRERSSRQIVMSSILEPIDPIEKTESSQQINAALGALPVDQREVVLLKTYQDMTFRQIGRVMKCSANTAASRYRYALAKLRELLGDEDNGHD